MNVVFISCAWASRAAGGVSIAAAQMAASRNTKALISSPSPFGRFDGAHRSDAQTRSMTAAQVLEDCARILGRHVRLRAHVHHYRVPLLRRKLTARPRVMALRAVNGPQPRPVHEEPHILGFRLRSRGSNGQKNPGGPKGEHFCEGFYSHDACLSPALETNSQLGQDCAVIPRRARS